MKDLLKPTAYFILIIAAALFTFVFPGSGLEQIIVPAVGSLFGYLGLKSWRNDYGQFREWFKSKTIVGALIVLIPVLALAASALFAFPISGTVSTIITTLITLGGGTSLVGIVHAYVKTKKEETQ